MKPIQLVAQLYDIKTKRDGGSRLTLDTGLESLEGIQNLLGFMAHGEMNLHVVIVPEHLVREGLLEPQPESHSEDNPDAP
jgi:hypothetical protein